MVLHVSILEEAINWYTSQHMRSVWLMTIQRSWTFWHSSHW